MIELARQRVSGRADFRVHDLASPMDWAEAESFDVAVMALVIHHLDDRISTLREIHRVLRPHGRLVVSTHHPTSDWLRKGGSYFEVSVIEETWKRGWNVRYWRLPLSVSAAEFSESGFLIERLVEPQPTQELRDRFPDEYKSWLASQDSSPSRSRSASSDSSGRARRGSADMCASIALARSTESASPSVMRRAEWPGARCPL